MAAATAALPAPPQVLLMPGQTVRSRKTTTAHRQQMTSRHVRILPFGGYPAPQNDQLKCRKGKQRLTAGARWEGKMCGATRATRPRRESARIGRPAALPTPGDRSRLLQPCGLGHLAPSLKFGAFVGFSGRRDTPKGGVDPPQGGGLPRLERGGRSECVQPKTAHLRSVNAFSRPQILFAKLYGFVRNL